MNYILMFLFVFLCHVSYSQLTVFGEVIPLENERIRYKLIKEIEHIEKAGITPSNLYQKASKLFPYYDYELERHGIPNDFKYLSVVESNLNNNVQSGVGAAGLWQIMPTTARELGLTVSRHYDERYHIRLATQAAMRYLVTNYRRLKNWTLTAASYNCGLGCINNSISKSGRSNFYYLKLNKETTDYIYRIAAVKIMFEKYIFGKNIDLKKLETESNYYAQIKKQLDNQQHPNKVMQQKDLSIEIVDTLFKTKFEPAQLIEIGRIELKTLVNNNLEEDMKLKVIKSDDKDIIEGSYLKFISKYEKESQRVYFSMSGIEINPRYIDRVVKVYDKDGNEGLSIVDFGNELPQNYKLHAKILEYK